MRWAAGPSLVSRQLLCQSLQMLSDSTKVSLIPHRKTSPFETILRLSRKPSMARIKLWNGSVGVGNCFLEPVKLVCSVVLPLWSQARRRCPQTRRIKSRRSWECQCTARWGPLLAHVSHCSMCLYLPLYLLQALQVASVAESEVLAMGYGMSHEIPTLLGNN